MSVELGADASVFRRAQTPLAHGVYGLILALATIGELIRHDVGAGESAAWILSAGGVILAAHLFSDVLAETVATQRDPNWAEILRVSREDVSVVVGFLGAALIMAVAAVGDLDAQSALVVCVVVGVLAVAGLSFYATAHHGLLVRAIMGLVAVALGGVIVVLENTV